MANIATLTVTLLAETARFSVGLKKSNAEANRFARNVRKTLLPIAKTAAAVGVALAVMGRQSIKAADNIGKTAKAVGLAAETLQELRFAAEQSGIEIRGIDDSMRRFNRRLGEFATSGGGPAAKAVKDLGINVRDTAGQVRSSELIFNDVVDSLQRIDSQAQRSALAAQLFGDDFGPKLVTLLDQGTEGIAKLRQEARDLGFVMSNETVASAEDAEDTFNRLDRIVRGRMIKAFADNAEAIEAATEAIIDFVNATISGFNRVRLFFGLETETEELRRQLAEVDDAIAKTRKAIKKGVEGSEVGLTGLGNFGIGTQMRAITGGQEASNARLEELLIERDKLVGKLNLASLERSQLAAEAPEQTGTTFGTGGLGDFDKLQARTDALRESLRSSLEELFAFRRELDLLIEKTDLTEEEAAEAYNRMAEEIEEAAGRTKNAFGEGFDEAADESKQAIKRMEEFAKQSARNIQDAFADFFFDPFDDGLDGLLHNFVNTLRRMVANLLASNLLGLLSSIGGPVGSFFGLALGPKAALGGFRRDRPFIAGDRGPELIAPGTGATAIPLAGAVFNFQTNISSSGGLDAATLIPILDENNRKLKAEFIDQLRRGQFQ